MLVWEDNFDQQPGSLPNPNIWELDNGLAPTNGNVNYTNKNSRLQVVDDPAASAPDHRALAMTIEKTGVDAKNNPLFKSARIITANKGVGGRLQYGRVEARIRLSSYTPSGTTRMDPVFPAFWMLGSDGRPPPTNPPTPAVRWPWCGEIDIMEYNGNAETTTGTLVADKQPYRPEDPNQPLQPEFYKNSYLLASLGDGQYHTYAIDWSPGSVRFEVDGNHYATVKRGFLPGEIPDYLWTFDRPFYVVLNVAAFPSQPADFTTQTMYVDYVRAYAPSTPTGLSALF
jgi:beta-glucanase (GH16 family)